MGFSVYPTNGRQSRMNGSVVRTQQFKLCFTWNQCRSVQA